MRPTTYHCITIPEGQEESDADAGDEDDAPHGTLATSIFSTLFATGSGASSSSNTPAHTKGLKNHLPTASPKAPLSAPSLGQTLASKAQSVLEGRSRGQGDHVAKRPRETEVSDLKVKMDSDTKDEVAEYLDDQADYKSIEVERAEVLEKLKLPPWNGCCLSGSSKSELMKSCKGLAADAQRVYKRCVQFHIKIGKRKAVPDCVKNFMMFQREEHRSQKSSTQRCEAPRRPPGGPPRRPPGGPPGGPQEAPRRAQKGHIPARPSRQFLSGVQSGRVGPGRAGSGRVGGPDLRQ